MPTAPVPLGRGAVGGWVRCQDTSDLYVSRADRVGAQHPGGREPAVLADVSHAQAKAREVTPRYPPLAPRNGWRHNVIIDSMRVEMPRSLSVRNLDEDLVARLKIRAARHGRSAEAEHREILRQALEKETEVSFDALAAELRALTSERRQTPSEDLLREGRDER